ncbi:unnamed protein product, partial [Prorocentrum cordatum]
MGAAAGARRGRYEDVDIGVHPAEAFDARPPKGGAGGAVGSRQPRPQEKPSPVESVRVRSAGGGAATWDGAAGLAKARQEAEAVATMSRIALSRPPAPGGDPGAAPAQALAIGHGGDEPQRPRPQAGVARAPPGSAAARAQAAPARAAAAIGAREQKEAEAAALAAVRAVAASQGGAVGKKVNFDLGVAAFAPGVPAARVPAQQFEDVEVGLVARKAIAHWVRCGRRSLEARRLQAAERRRALRRRRGARRPARVDRLVSLFAESQEQLQDLCLHDPRQVVATQIELLTRRIEWYGKETDAASQAPSSGRTDGPVVLPVPAGLVKPTAPRPPARVIAAIDTSSRPDVGVDEVADEIVPPVLPKMHRWEASFDQAMRSKQHWKQDHAARVQRQAPAQPPAQQAPTRDRGTGADGLGKAPSNGELVAQLRAERERLEALLPRFER